MPKSVNAVVEIGILAGCALLAGCPLYDNAGAPDTNRNASAAPMRFATVASTLRASSSERLPTSDSAQPTAMAVAWTGPIIRAASCNAADVQKALNDAPDGATVEVPGGRCDWGQATVSRAAGVHLKGPGSRRIIIRRSMTPGGWGDYALKFTCDNGKPLELSGFTFEGNGDLTRDDNGVVLMETCRDFKIHHNVFSKYTYSALTIRGNARGVVYQNKFWNNFKMGLGYGVSVYGDGTYPARPRLGSADMVFVENNDFYDNRHSIASNFGSHYVFRHNKVVSSLRAKWQAQVDAHGRTSFGAGSRSWEVYDNDFSGDAEITAWGGHASMIGMRGGDGVIYNNRFTVKSGIWFAVEKSGWACSDFTTWPVVGQTVAGYLWNNGTSTLHAVQSAENEYGCDWRKFLQLGRDFKTEQMPGYVPYTYPHPLRYSSNGSGPPVITTWLQPVTTYVGGDVSFTIAATGATPFSYRWYHDGDLVTACTGSTCRISPVIQADAGTYAVEVINPAGQTSSNFVRLDINAGPPAITRALPKHTFGQIGGSASFTVLATGAAPLVYRWYRDGYLIGACTGKTCRIAPLTRADAGIYTVEVTNPAGRALSKTQLTLMP